MNLLTVSKKKTLTKLKDNNFGSVSGTGHMEYCGFQNQLTTPRLDNSRWVSSFIPGFKTVDSMSVADILSDHRN